MLLICFWILVILLSKLYVTIKTKTNKVRITVLAHPTLWKEFVVYHAFAISSIMCPDL